MVTLAAALAGSTTVAVAQQTAAQERAFRFGVTAGANISTAFVTNATGSTVKPGWQAGLAFDYAFSQKFLLQWELSFIDKGAKVKGFLISDYDGDGGEGNWTDRIDQQYVELSLAATKRVKLSPGWDLIWGAGPYFAYGVGGKDRHKLINGVYGDYSTERTYKTFETTYFTYTDYLGEVFAMPEEANLRRFDWGLGLRVGVEHRRVSLTLGLDQGLTNIAVDRNDLTYINTSLSLSAGYKL